MRRTDMNRLAMWRLIKNRLGFIPVALWTIWPMLHAKTASRPEMTRIRKQFISTNHSLNLIMHRRKRQISTSITIVFRILNLFSMDLILAFRLAIYSSIIWWFRKYSELLVIYVPLTSRVEACSLLSSSCAFSNTLGNIKLVLMYWDE